MEDTIREILREVCGDEILEADGQLASSGLLDSLAVIELVDRLEEQGILLPITRLTYEEMNCIKSLAQACEAM